MVTDIEKTIRDYLPTIIHLSLATCAGDKPWVCEIHFSFDENLNLYFRSTTSRRHSMEIAKNKFVAGNIVKEHSVDDKPRGVYFEGEAEILAEVDEDNPAFKTYCHRFDTGREILEEAKEDDGHKFYKIKVNKFYLFDARESESGKKYELNWNK